MYMICMCLFIQSRKSVESRFIRLPHFSFLAISALVCTWGLDWVPVFPETNKFLMASILFAWV